MTIGLKTPAFCPVMGADYEYYLKSKIELSRAKAHSFLAQWYAFSAAMPELLSICAMNAANDIERANIIINLYSELGLDRDGHSHSELLKDLIVEATGIVPDGTKVTASTRRFLSSLRESLIKGRAAENAGCLQALEAVAYQILSVLKEILMKSGNPHLLEHPYIVIHEEVEAQHIAKTQENIILHLAEKPAADAGYAETMRAWADFWTAAYRNISSAE